MFFNQCQFVFYGGCFVVLLNRYKFLFVQSSGLAPTGELRGCLVSPLIIRPRGEGSICGGRTLGVALPSTPRAFLGLVVKRIGFCFVAIRGCALRRSPRSLTGTFLEKKEGRRSVSDDGPKGGERRSAQPRKTRGRRAIYQGSRMSAAPLRVVVDGEPKSNTKALT